MRVLATLVSMGRGVPRYVVALLLAVFLISGTAWAYTAFGSGTTTCGSWTEAKEEPMKRVAFHEWINGYMTAYSLWVEGDGPGPVTNSEGSGNWAWMDNYCRDNPLDDVSDAAAQLINAIKAN